MTCPSSIRSSKMFCMMVRTVIKKVGGRVCVVVEDIEHLIVSRSVKGFRLSKCCDSLLIGGSGRTCNKDTGVEGDTLGGWRR